MRSFFITLLFSVLFCGVATSQSDTIYFMKNGNIINKQSVKPADVDSMIFYKPNLAQQISGTFVDARDGNIYKWIKIGNQTWMAENLRYLPSVVPQSIGDSNYPYYYVMGYNGTNVADAKASANYNTHGVLYNWPAIVGASPAGWHVPTNEEMMELETYLSAHGYNYDGSLTGGSDKLAKSMAASSGWSTSTVTGAPGNNDYPGYRDRANFSAIPGGLRDEAGIFIGFGNNGYWWSSTNYFDSYVTDRPWFWNINHYDSNLTRTAWFSMEYGLSVLCIKN